MPYPKNRKRKKLREIARVHSGRRLPYVLYKKPGASRIWALLQEDTGLERDLDLTRPGFVMAPFHPDGAPPVYLRADKIFHSPYKGPIVEQKPALPLADEVAREIHLQLVGKSVEAVKKGLLQKVVVSRRFSVPAPADAVSCFFELTRWYPDAFVYLWHHPDIGTWMGATPELLLRYHSGVSETIALAGTRPVDDSGKGPVWTPKERHEQQLVTDYILERMKKLQLKPQAGEVREIRAGNLWHLGTEIRAFIKPGEVPGLLRALHPTPAVCGIPADTASDFILRHENYNREFYTGFLGEVAVEKSASMELFVNLRCAQLRNGRAYVYVGGGITAASDPQAEWEETQAKSRVMLSILTNSI